ncbi:MAG TPA: hypothetical protein VN838_02540, partial [Bradyrhizobium sp.]|nr:hypothetical protein [Bradyrhizobium sp.]
EEQLAHSETSHVVSSFILFVHWAWRRPAATLETGHIFRKSLHFQVLVPAIDSQKDIGGFSEPRSN